MAWSFVDNVKDVENVLLNQIESLNNESDLKMSDEEFERMCKRADATSKVVSQYVNVNNLKLNVVRTADATDGVYNNVLGLASKDKNESKHIEK